MEKPRDETPSSSIGMWKLFFTANGNPAEPARPWPWPWRHACGTIMPGQRPALQRADTASGIQTLLALGVWWHSRSDSAQSSCRVWRMMDGSVLTRGPLPCSVFSLRACHHPLPHPSKPLRHLGCRAPCDLPAGCC